ncbi:MAG: 30S ribosomal protein S6 [Eubacteriales bacterium]
MEKIIRSYETIFVVDPDIGDDAVKALVEKFTALIAENGEIGAVNEWGRRRLAYPINYKNDGYFVLVTFKAESAFPTELERIYNITDGIIRSIIVNLDEK